jgi:hypothetical protein
MTDIHDLHTDALKKLLIINKKKGYNNYDYYNTTGKIDKLYMDAFILMQTPGTSYKDVSRNIILWLLAYNALQNNVIPKNKKYTSKEINNLSTHELNNLAKSLGMRRNNIENVKKILLYMDKLHGDLDFGNKQYQDLWEPLILNSDFEGVITLLKTNPELQSTIQKLLPQIIVNNLNPIKMSGGGYHDSKFNILIYDLINLNQVDLVNESLKIINRLVVKDEDIDYYYVGIMNAFLEKNILNIYFENLPTNYREFYLFDDTLNLLAHYFGNKKYDKICIIIKETLLFTLKNNRDDIFTIAKSYYIKYKGYLNSTCREEISNLIEEGEKLFSK